LQYSFSSSSRKIAAQLSLSHLIVIKRKFMKIRLLTGPLWVAAWLFSASLAAETKSDAWQNSVLTEATIKKVLEAKAGYKKCIGEHMQKPAYLDMDSRKATDEITKQCEPSLATMREVYLADKVPGEIADRHLRQTRIQVTRKLLEELLFAQATRQPGKP
jgi:hypothetical protein